MEPDLTDLPSTLYHYTSQAGLLGIVSEMGIRATDIHYLNDGCEFHLCLDITEEYLANIAKIPGTGLRGRVIDAFRRWLERVAGPQVFVASFTEEGDLLSQWRGYGSPGDAFALGFDSAALVGAVLPFWRLARCLYTEPEHMAAIETYVEERLTLAEKYVGDFPEQDLEESIDSKGFEFVANLVRLAPVLKDSSFAEEKEWRLISPWRTKGSSIVVNFRPGRHTLIPYCDFPLGDFRSDRLDVIVGPGQHPLLSQRAVGAFLQSQECQSYAVRVSSVPFRDW